MLVGAALRGSSGGIKAGWGQTPNTHAQSREYSDLVEAMKDVFAGLMLINGHCSRQRYRGHFGAGRAGTVLAAEVRVLRWQNFGRTTL